MPNQKTKLNLLHCTSITKLQRKFVKDNAIFRILLMLNTNLCAYKSFATML